MASKYFRRFPGKRRFERVSKDDWDAPMPHRDVAGWGHIGVLEADVRLWNPDGELVLARKWPARSYIRNFARILRGTFGQSNQLVDRTGTNRTTALNDNPSSAIGLTAFIYQETVNIANIGNCELSGVGMAIGNGVPAENHQRNDLVARVGGIYSSRQNVYTTVLNTTTTTLQVTTGVTNGQAISLDISEMGMFLYGMYTTAGATVSVPFTTLLTYDGISPVVPVATGGVIAPRYTMNFPI